MTIRLFDFHLFERHSNDGGRRAVKMNILADLYPTHNVRGGNINFIELNMNFTEIFSVKQGKFALDVPPGALHVT